jgi:hypothetical protein
VDIGPVEQHAPSTSGKWIRRGTRRYTQQGAAFQNSSYVPRQPSRHPLRNQNTYQPQYNGPSQSAIAYKKPPSTGPAQHTVPLRASGRSRPPPTSTKLGSHQTWSCAANTHNPLETTLQTRLKNPTWSIWLQTLTTLPRIDMCYCGIGPRMRPPRTTTTSGAITRDVRSLHSTMYPNHPQPPKTGARLWNPHMLEDSRRL